MMKNKKLGNFEVHPIGIGTWTIGGEMERRSGGEEKAIEAIKYSIGKGQNHIDTAELYGDGHAEEIVGEAIKDVDRKKLFIASKVFKNHKTSAEVTKAVEASLGRLEIDYLDMIYIHSPNVESTIKDYMEGLNKAVDLGLTKALAVSNFNVEQMKEAKKYAKHPILANQIVYNILMKQDASLEFLKYCKDEDVRVVAYRPVERGLLADKTENKTVLKMAERYKKAPSQIAINWLISQENVLTIPKSVNKKHIDENLESMDFKLSKKDWEELDKVAEI